MLLELHESCVADCTAAVAVQCLLESSWLFKIDDLSINHWLSHAVDPLKKIRSVYYHALHWGTSEFKCVFRDSTVQQCIFAYHLVNRKSNVIQIKICAEYRDMLPRPRLVCQEPGLRPIGRSPGVPNKSSRGLGSMSRYFEQILICFIAYIFLFFIPLWI